MARATTPPPSSPRMWIFPKIQTVDGYLEPRIMRLDLSARLAFKNKYGSTANLNPYLWQGYFPENTVILSGESMGIGSETLGGISMDNIIEMSGDIDYSYSDEFAGIRIAKCSFDFIDTNGYNGRDGNGNFIPFQSLFLNGTSLYQFIFSDKSEDTSYIFWTTLYSKQPTGVLPGWRSATGAPSNFLKVTFVGDIDKNTMPDQALLIRNDENPSALLRIPKIRMNCFPCWDRIQKYKMRDLVYNYFQDGNIPITESDMNGYNATTHPHRKAFVAGFKVKTGQENSGLSFAEDFTADSLFDTSAKNKNIPDNYNVINAILQPATGGSNGAQVDVTTENLTSWRMFEAIGSLPNPGYFKPPYNALTVTECDPNSFRNGWFPITLRTFINKIAEWCGCDPSILSQIDSQITGGNAKFNDTNKGYDCQSVSLFNSANIDSQTDFITIWNIMMGLNPQGCRINKTTSSAANAIRVNTWYIDNSIFGNQGTMNFVEGMQVFVEGADDPYANGIWTIANIESYVNPTGINEVDFDLVNSNYSKASSAAGGTVTQFFSSPVTFVEQDGFEVFIKNFLWQFNVKLKFPITQSGDYIGMPFMKFVPRWVKGKPIPKDGNGVPLWRQGVKFDKQPRKITSDCIQVSQMGDSGYCICPANGKLPPLQIPPLRWRTHQYGTSNAVYPPNLVFDAATGKNLFSESDVAYTYASFGDNLNLGVTLYSLLLEGNGWIPGSYLYESYIDAPHSNPRLPSVWNDWADINKPFASDDWSACYALQSLFWNNKPFLYGETKTLLPNQYNAMFDIARLAALEFVVNKEMYIRDFAGLTYLDDLDDEYEDKWQEAGKDVYYKMYNRTYNQIWGTLSSSEWVASPIDKYGNLNYDNLDNAPEVAFFGGASTGAGGTSSSGTGSSATNNSSSTTNNFNSIYTPRTRTLNLYSGGVITKTLTAMTFERFDSVANRTVVQYAFPVEFDPQTFDIYGLNTLALIHYKGTEHGNVEIVGVSAAGVPDYWFSGLVQEKRQQGSDANVNYFPQGIMWSEDNADFLLQRIFEAANPNRRMFFAGRIQCSWNFMTNTFDNITWKTLTSPEYQFSDDEIKSNSDLGIIGAARTSPTIIPLGSTLTLTWGNRFKPVAMMNKGWMEYWGTDDHSFANKMDYQLGVNPLRNQQPNPNSATVTWWMNNFAGAVGQRHTTFATATDISAIPLGELLFHVTVFGSIEIIGENATAL